MGKTILLLILVGFIPVLFSGLARYLDINTKLKNLKNICKQIIFGVAFGILSIIGSELGVKTPTGAIINVRDVGPACAGLMFGMPSGIIAGAIGGLERYFIGSGDFTRIACSFSTFMAGVFAGLVRKLVFNNHHGTWYYGFVLGLFIESFHLLMVYVTNMDNVEKCTTVIEQCAVPMILCNTLCIVLSLVWVTIISKEKLFDVAKPRKINFYVQTGLTTAVVISFALISSLTYSILNNLSISSTTTTLTLNIQDVKNDVDRTLNDNMLEIVEDCATYIKEEGTSLKIVYDTIIGNREGTADGSYLYAQMNATLEEIVQIYNITEASVVVKMNWSTQNLVTDEMGFKASERPLNGYSYILYSSLATNIKFCMDSTKQSSKFNVLNNTLTTESELVQEYGPIGQDSNIKKKYAGIALPDFPGCYLQIGYGEEDYHTIVDELVSNSIENRHIGKTGSIVILNEEKDIVAGLDEEDADLVTDFEFKLDQLSKSTFEGIDYYYYIEYIEGYYIVAIYPIEEANQSRNIALYVTILIEIIIFCMLYMIIYVTLKRLVVDRISKTNSSLDAICAGDLNVVLPNDTIYEFQGLASHINSTVNSLKEYSEEVARKIEADLALAKSIQHSVLPSTFPPYPNHHEFDIYASMDTAKEVGGDFYDFYLVDDKHLAILIADVSGKGIPAAMFMMQAKTIIKSLVTSGMELDNAITIANNRLCEGNSAQMFVTVWMGIIDLDTGHVNYVNAGHNPPLVKRNGTDFEYLKGRAGFVLAGMDGIRYKLQEFDLQAGDQIYLYTDGVTEANNKEQKLYSEDRLLKTVNKAYGLSSEAFCQSIMDDVEEFEDGADQFDDITMLSVIYYGKRNLEELKIGADVKNGEKVIDFINTFLEKNDASMRAINQIDVAVDEIFSNIAFYAYSEGNSGSVNVVIEAIDNYVNITFEDHGMEYNPLENEDPDITLSAEDRKIGGLGIFIVKKTMDDVKYANINGRNLLTLKKTIK